jgi:hypothetical protein
MSKRNIVHVEIPSADHEKAGAFYRGLFGWNIKPMPEANYALWEPEEGPGGGFSPLSDDTRVGEILIHVDSDDIDADLAKVRSLGGAVVRPKTEVPNIGWYAIFSDPTGNSIALFTSRAPTPS